MESKSNTFDNSNNKNIQAKLISTKLLNQVKKRDGKLADFDLQRIANAIYRAFLETREGSVKQANQVANAVMSELLLNASHLEEEYVPNVESIQDIVESSLMREGYAPTAKAYILYRQMKKDERAGIVKEKKQELQVRPEIKKAFEDNKKYFQNPLAELVYFRTYSKWSDALGRREVWHETVQRFTDFMRENLQGKLTEEEYTALQDGFLNQKFMPSMRLVWSSGPAARSTNVAAYNCSFIAPTKLIDFGEIMYISMCGTGVGYTVETHHVQKLPIIKKQTGEKAPTIVVPDSKEGWANSYVKALEYWFDGYAVTVDYSLIRKNGARLKTMGGRASGPQPLFELMEFTEKRVLANQGKRLSNIDVHDIICEIGCIVQAGGVRRSAMISLSDLSDGQMRDAKHGQFWLNNPQRSMANNSAVYEEKPSAEVFLKEWMSLIASKSGERGIFNRGGLKTQLPKRRLDINKDKLDMFGTNPCGEIYLRSKQFCNLTNVVVRAEDTLETLKEKVKWATVLGTYQASLTHFPFLSKEWADNSREEALLGVCLTGYFDNEVIRDPKVLNILREYAVEVNKEYAKRFGINQSTCVTSVKPSGNSSQALNTSSGMHPRYSDYYIRRVRISAGDPLFKAMKAQGVNFNPEVGQNAETATSFVLDFAVKSPEGSITKDQISAIDLLNEWLKLKVNYTEHNPSATIYVKDSEWIEVGNWVYKNWENVGGLSFLPHSDHVYQLAPYEPCDEATYLKIKETTDKIDFSKLVLHELEDATTGAKELACVAGGCEI